jgi:hypothetical protein
MSVYDRDAPLHAQPRLAQEQVQGARADYEVMRATTWRWGDGRLMTEYEMMYIAAALQRGTDEFPWAAEELARSRDLLQQWEAQRRAEREARAMPLLKFWGLSLVGLPVVSTSRPRWCATCSGRPVFRRRPSAIGWTGVRSCADTQRRHSPATSSPGATLPPERASANRPRRRCGLDR